MTLGKKVILGAAGGVLLTMVGGILAVYSICHENRINEVQRLMRSTLQQAQSVMLDTDELHNLGAFDIAKLSAGGTADYRTSILYKTAPVVNGWNSVKAVAKTNGFEF